MGGGDGGGEAEVQESALSKKQAEIVKDREAFYQKTTKPALLDFYADAQNFKLNNDLNDFSTLVDTVGKTFDMSSDASAKSLSNILSQRGLGEAQSEVDKLFNAKNMKAKGQAVNGARIQEIMQHNTQIDQRNQNKTKEMSVKQSALSSLLSQTPLASRGGSPIFIQSQAQDGSSATRAGLGAIGGMASAFSGTSNQNNSSQPQFTGGFAANSTTARV